MKVPRGKPSYMKVALITRSSSWSQNFLCCVGERNQKKLLSNHPSPFRLMQSLLGALGIERIVIDDYEMSPRGRRF
jgi:hypothetical protein